MDKKNTLAATLQKKKNTINKAKVKKTIKNTLCRPDPVFWPIVAEEQEKTLEAVLARHKVEMPEYIKPHWKELKSIPKDQRPKPPKIKKVEGLIFGITECTEALRGRQCSSVIINSSVNPRAIVQPLIEACISNQVPIICLNGLRKISLVNFGIPTSSLAVKTGFLQELSSKIKEMALQHKVPKPLQEKHTNNVKLKTESADNKIKVAENMIQESTVESKAKRFSYLYRTSKNTRVFNPSLEEPKTKKAFVGQDFIEFSEKTEDNATDSIAYKSMILKKVTNNQNRTTKK